MDFQTLRELTFLGNTAFNWALAAGTTIVALLVLITVRSLLVRRLRALSAKTATPIDDALVGALAATKSWFLFVVGAVIGARFLELSDRADQYFGWAFIIAFALQIGLWVSRAVGIWTETYIERRRETAPGDVTAMQGVAFLARLIIWSAVLLLTIDNLGYDVTALVAGLGIGGIAVALALQNVLGDLFASLSIILDKPFVVGDFIIVGDMLGVVEKIGLKTTRVKSLSGEQIVFSNGDLLSSRVRNYKKMQERRVAFKFGVLYSTAVDELERIPGYVKEIIEGLEKTRFDRAHFQAFGASSLDFEIVYYVLGADYNLYMDIQQAINLGIARKLQERGVGFAFPTRTVHLVSDEPRESKREHDEERGSRAENVSP